LPKNPWPAKQVTKSKPDPEIFTQAAGQFASPPLAEQILVFEDLRMVSCFFRSAFMCISFICQDAPSGVEAGLAAGMQVGLLSVA